MRVTNQILFKTGLANIQRQSTRSWVDNADG